MDFLTEIISPERKERLGKLRLKEDRIRSVFGEALLRYVLALEYSIDSRSISFEYNSYGKPELSGPMKVSFNISHSGYWIGCVTGSGELGLDIERINRIKIPEISDTVFTSREIEFLNSLNGDDYINSFYRFWTLKESYIKARGMGIYLPLNSFGFKYEKSSGFPFLYTENNNISEFSFKSIELDRDHVTSICYPRESEKIDISYMDENDLLGSFK